MKKISVFVTLAVLTVLMQSVLQAQSNASGTWKLNTAKSKYSPGPAPQSATLTIDDQGNGGKVSAEGTAADGNRVAYGYTANFDGKDNPISGTGVPNGADTIALKRINPNTVEFTMKKAGKEVLTGRSVVSKDGKVPTITTKGTSANGQPTSSVGIYDKQ